MKTNLFGIVALGMGALSHEQLTYVLDVQQREDAMRLPHRRLGQICTDLGYLAPEQIVAIMERIRVLGLPLIYGKGMVKPRAEFQLAEMSMETLLEPSDPYESEFIPADERLLSHADLAARDAAAAKAALQNPAAQTPSLEAQRAAASNGTPGARTSLTLLQASQQLGIDAAELRQRIIRGDVDAEQFYGSSGPEWRVFLPSRNAAHGTQRPTPPETLPGLFPSAASASGLSDHTESFMLNEGMNDPFPDKVAASFPSLPANQTEVPAELYRELRERYKTATQQLVELHAQVKEGNERIATLSQRLSHLEAILPPERARRS